MIYLASQLDLEQQINQLSLRTVAVASLVLVIGTLLAVFFKTKHPRIKLPLFLIMAATLTLSAATLFATTIYLNNHSESGGPVHWHSDIEFWACGSELNLRDPIGALSNKIGSTTFHEHNDKRLHLEGVVVNKIEDAGLRKFMRLAGGSIEKRSLSVPLNKDPDTWFASLPAQQDGDTHNADNHSVATGNGEWITSTPDGAVVKYQDGQKCGPDSTFTKEARLQVFVYRYSEKDKTFAQSKLSDPDKYVMRDEAVVPPGDCVIVEFDVLKSRTDKLCRQYGIRDSERCEAFGVKQPTPKICNIRELIPKEDDE